MTDWFLGTIGFTYPEWKGSFYPTGLPAAQSLTYYSKIFNAVEINTTFYGAQPPAQLQRWAGATSPDFRFCLKAPKRITHELRLAGSALDEFRAFVDASSALGGQLGAILIQMPPSFKADEWPTLLQWIAHLPDEIANQRVRYAIELRHASWHEPEMCARLTDLLSQHQVGWVAADYEDLPVTIHNTAPFLYVRWIGKHNVLDHPGFEVIDRSARLQSWVERLRPYLDTLEGVFGFFDNDYAGHAPASVNRLKTLLRQPIQLPPQGEQGRLF